MQKKIITFLLLMCMLIGFETIVYAAASSASEYEGFVFNFRKIDEYGDYKYNAIVTGDKYLFIRVVNGAQQTVVAISDSSFSLKSEYIVDWLTNDSYVTDSSTVNAVSYSVKNGDNNALLYIYNVFSGVDCSITGEFAGTLDHTIYQSDASAYYQALYDILCGGSPDGYTPNDEVFNFATSTYDENIGSLKNIKLYAIKYTEHGSASTGLIDFTSKYTYSLTTTTGFDLSREGANVQYVIKKKGGYKTLLGDYFSLPTVMSDYYLAGNGKNYFYVDSDISIALNKVFRTDDVPLSASLDYTDYVYLRPVYFDGTKFYYGNWSKTYSNQNGGLVIENGVTDGEGGVISSEDDGEDDDFTPNGEKDETPIGTGDGTSLEDAEQNLIESFDDFEGLLDSFFNGINSLLNGIGKVPELIGQVFTAFPDSIIAAIGIGLVLAIVLRVLGR